MRAAKRWNYSNKLLEYVKGDRQYFGIHERRLLSGKCLSAEKKKTSESTQVVVTATPRMYQSIYHNSAGRKKKKKKLLVPVMPKIKLLDELTQSLVLLNCCSKLITFLFVCHNKKVPLTFPWLELLFGCITGN